MLLLVRLFWTTAPGYQLREGLWGSGMAGPCFFRDSWGHARPFSGVSGQAVSRRPSCLAVYLQGSAICCRSPCGITRRRRLRTEVGIFWPSVQLTSFRRSANSSGYRLPTGVPVDTTSYMAQATCGEEGSRVRRGWPSRLFSVHRIASRVDHTCDKSTQKREEAEGLLFWKLLNSGCVFLSWLPRGVTPKSSWHHQVSLGSFDNN